ncbi:Uncharacterized protein HZ326_26195 [Fusarium oxysporum f. sp. albedinis]|nr:Uncharacterized protein HZ326_26195 [Fusarium oxysporum f. sp. albedinis]
MMYNPATKKGSRLLSSHHYHNFFGIEWYRSRGEEPQDGAMLRSSTILFYDDEGHDEQMLRTVSPASSIQSLP